MVSYDKLEQFYIETTGYKPNIRYDETDDLNKNCPGHLYPNDEIRIWNKLVGRDLVEAKSHEVAHIILRYKGLIAIDVADEYEAFCACGSTATDFCMEINNAISHRFLIPMLKKDYGIDSNLQQKLRIQTKEDVVDIKTIFPGHDPIMHIQGIVAYDILQCNFAQNDYIKEIITIDNEMRKSFDIALRHLSSINIGQPIKIQVDTVKQFLVELGYPPSAFKIIEPFPLLQHKHRSLLDAEFTSQPT